MKYSWLEYLTFLAKLEQNTITRVELLRKAKEYELKDKPPPTLAEYMKLMTIPGIGESKAKELVNNNINYENINKHLQFLPHESQLFLKYKPITEIPKEIAQKIADKICKKYNTKFTKPVISGSVRRCMAYSKDIDIIVITENSELPHELIPNNKLILSRGENKMAFLVKYKQDYYKIDMYFTKSKNFPYMLLYLTGSKEFNIKMRAHAKSRGFLLNQNGLFRDGHLVNNKAKTEKDIFNLIGMKYIEPSER